MADPNAFIHQVPNLVVGEHTETFLLESLEGFCCAIDHMTSQAKRSVKIFTQELAHDFYDREVFIEQVSNACRQSRDSHLHILLKDANKATKLGHRLVELKKQLPSLIEIRSVPIEYENVNDEYLIVDDIAMVKQFALGNLRGHCAFRAIPDAVKYARQFNEIWERSLPCRELGRLHI